MGRTKQLKIDLENLYKVSDVRIGFDYWFYKLLNYLVEMFEYDNVPETIPEREIEMNLMLTGHAVFFRDVGDLICIPTEIYGYDRYYRPTKATFGNVEVKSKDLTFGKNAEIVYNNKIRGNVLNMQSVDNGLLTMILRYSRMLADVESTLNIRMINSRQTSFAVAKSQQMSDQLKALYDKIEVGDRSVLSDTPFLDAFQNVDIASKSDAERVNDLLIAREKILSMFFREIGVKFEQEQKKAQLTEDEVTADEQLLLINPLTMLKERQEGIERVNRHFGTNIQVRINPAYDRRGVENNGDSDERLTD